MKDLKKLAKLSVLDEIQKMFEDKDIEQLKSKSKKYMQPKIAKVEIQSNDADLADKIKEKMLSASEDSNEMVDEDCESESDLESNESDESSEDLKKKLLEMYSKLK